MENDLNKSISVCSGTAETPSIAFTPGPWGIGRSCDHTPAITVPEEQGSGFVIAHINRIPRMKGVRGDADANARLIAAAPTMAEYIGKRAEAGDAEAAAIMEAIRGHA